LGVASLGYGLAVHVRNALYDHRLLRTHRMNAIVLSVGNLTTGGTGKTPLVAWLCQTINQRSKIKNQNCQVAILTRGYKMQEGEMSDEPALLSAQCPGVAVIVNPDRVAGAAEAIRAHGAQVLIMDDGFQHRRLARDLDIVAIDATQPFGFGKMLPAGLLREPVAGLRRAHAVVLTRCDQLPQDTLEQIEEDVHRINHDLVIARSIHSPVGIRMHEGTEIGVEEIRGKRLFAFCGIGNPQSFFHTVERLDSRLVGSRVYDDHYRYETSDLNRIREEAVRQQAEMVLTTQKDWTKIAKLAGLQGHPPLAYLAVELQIVAGAQELMALIDRLLGGRMPHP
jgi:tetraacyldisaccharide 4'-kinase